MKTTLVAIFFVTLFAVQAFGQQVQKKEVYMYPNDVVLELLLKKWNMDYKRIKSDKYIVYIEGNRTIIDIYNDLTPRISAQRAFKAKPSLARINDFNKIYFGARAYLDNDSVVISSDLVFEGGVASEVIEGFLYHFDVIYEEAEAELN